MTAALGWAADLIQYDMCRFRTRKNPSPNLPTSSRYAGLGLAHEPSKGGQTARSNLGGFREASTFFSGTARAEFVTAPSCLFKDNKNFAVVTIARA
jgi:hypothetical protein